MKEPRHFTREEIERLVPEFNGIILSSGMARWIHDGQRFYIPQFVFEKLLQTRLDLEQARKDRSETTEKWRLNLERDHDEIARLKTSIEQARKDRDELLTYLTAVVNGNDLAVERRQPIQSWANSYVRTTCKTLISRIEQSKKEQEL